MNRNEVYLSLGTDQGDLKLNLNKARNAIVSQIGEIKSESSIFESAPWGFISESNFYNQVVMVNTVLDPFQLLDKIKLIEKKMGRVNKITDRKYSSRIIDIDILIFENEIIANENLVIPHKHMNNRMFVLKPLNEIAADLVHPVNNRKISEILKECNDKGMVARLI